MAPDVKNMLETNPDYIAIKRYKNSLTILENRYPDGAPDHIIAKALLISEEEVEKRYQEIVALLRQYVGVQ